MRGGYDISLSDDIAVVTNILLSHINKHVTPDIDRKGLYSNNS